MTMRLCALTLAALLFVPSGFAVPTGADVLRACVPAVKKLDGVGISKQDSIKADWCVVYLSGLLDGILVSAPKDRSTQFVCLPEQGITKDQLVRVVTKSLQEHPENLHETGRMEALIALMKAFPCK